MKQLLIFLISFLLCFLTVVDFLQSNDPSIPFLILCAFAAAGIHCMISKVHE